MSYLSYQSYLSYLIILKPKPPLGVIGAELKIKKKSGGSHSWVPPRKRFAVRLTVCKRSNQVGPVS